MECVEFQIIRNAEKGITASCVTNQTLLSRATSEVCKDGLVASELQSDPMVGVEGARREYGRGYVCTR